jgi:hypothetical protein
MNLSFLSDLLHFDRSHGELLDTVCTLLAPNDKARVYVTAGVYRKFEVCAAFLRQAMRHGFVWIDNKGVSQDWREVDDVVESTLPMHGISWDQLGSAESSHRHVPVVGGAMVR